MNPSICVKLRTYIGQYNTHSCVGQALRIDILYYSVGVQYMYGDVTIDVFAVPQHIRRGCCIVHHDIIVGLHVPVHQQNLRNTKRSLVSIWDGSIFATYLVGGKRVLATGRTRTYRDTRESRRPHVQRIFIRTLDEPVFDRVRSQVHLGH